MPRARDNVLFQRIYLSARNSEFPFVLEARSGRKLSGANNLECLRALFPAHDSDHLFLSVAFDGHKLLMKTERYL